MSTTKKISEILHNNRQHWVGDGFPVRSLFAYTAQGERISPFLMLDYGGPTSFPPTAERKGVGEHPHRGFETVTIVYDGEVEHRDSAGGGGKIGPGDVQWMTAASGLVHEEFHGTEYAKSGGPFEMAQLWVNLPAKDKMTEPGYQGITSDQIPVVKLPGEAGTVRVIAGEYAGTKGPARTFSPVEVWDIRLRGGRAADLSIPEGYTLMLAVFKGPVRVNGSEEVKDAEVALFERTGTEFRIESATDTKILLLAGQPLNEPIVGYGPFVMNTEDEIRQAIQDFQTGKMGRLG